MKRNRSLIHLLLVLVLGTSMVHAQENKISVSVDPRFEVVSTVCRLADFDEYNMGSYPDYYQLVGDHFKDFKDHEAVKLMQKLRKRYSISYNAPMGFAGYLKSIDDISPIVPMDPIPDELDSRWKPESFKAFSEVLQQFITDTDYKTFYTSQKNRFDTAVQRFEEVLKDEDLVSWFNQYFGIKAENDFQLILGLQNGGANYGASTIDSKGKKTLYSVIGCWKQDDAGMPVYTNRVIETVVHEFCHSYTNPIVAQNLDILEDSGKKIFRRIGPTMTQLAYGSWKVMYNEYFVRACVVRFMHHEKGEEAAEKRAAYDIKRGFVGLDQFANHLANYEENRDKYPTFQDFLPELILVLDKIAEEVNMLTEEQKKEEEAKWEKIRTEGPQLLKMTPSNNSKSLPSSLTEFRFHFDRPMDTNGMAVMTSDEDGVKFPELDGSPYFEDEDKVFVMKVKLEPNTTYKFSLNHKSMLGFKDSNGMALYPIEIELKTK